MKMINNWAARVLATLLLLATSVLTFAQDKGADIDVDINKGGGSAWYTNPIVWVIGGAVFILLLVALLRGNNSRN